MSVGWKTICRIPQHFLPSSPTAICWKSIEKMKDGANFVNLVWKPNKLLFVPNLYLCCKTKQLEKDYGVPKAVRKLLELGYERFSWP